MKPNDPVSEGAAGAIAHLNEDHDGLVNLFDLGIVLSVAFLLAALSSLDLTSALTAQSKTDRATRPANAVVTNKNQRVRELELNPGQRVIGRGEPVGTLYRLSDGRTVLVEEPR